MNYNEYEDKVALNENVEIPNINKVTDDDMNYIKYNLPHIGKSVDSSYRTNILHSKNMLNNTLSTQTKNDITFTKNSDGSITLNGTASANTTLTLGIVSLKSGKTYTLSGGEDLSIDTVRLDMRLSESGNLYDGNWYIPNYPTKTMANDITLYASIRVQSGASFTNKVIYPMLEEGSTATTYEPFTYNEVIVNNEKYTDTINVDTIEDSRSKVNFVKSLNLFNSGIINGNVSDSAIQSSSNRVCTASFIEVEPSTQYTLSFTGNLGQINISYFTNNSFPRESESGWTSTFTFTTKSNTKYIMISWRKSNNNENISLSDIIAVMLNKGNSALAFQYYGTSINVEGEDIYNQNIMNYSTSETRIGTWLGKPLYRKVVNIGSLPNSTSKNVSTGLSNIDTMCKLYGTAYGSGNMLPIPHASASSIASSIDAFLTNNYGTLTIQTGSDRSSYQGYVIVEYTKTTD